MSEVLLRPSELHWPELKLAYQSTGAKLGTVWGDPEVVGGNMEEMVFREG